MWGVDLQRLCQGCTLDRTEHLAAFVRDIESVYGDLIEPKLIGYSKRRLGVCEIG